MLQIQNIRKVYKTGTLVQTALNGVSLNLRDNEFVAILGPSGSGKTTLLNVIGGLDRYDSGELAINGVSTKKYTARDWDSYRNHTVGFVFQSYNLIPHQTILSNVELALTISGISQRERKQRATEALQQVGLGEHMHKKPSQLSGGQMQRVAIARALVNNPDILLADEPTGALDSETSLQVMDLLKEVARDRLVVMVTHNPELAEEYATRIVRLKDGKIIDDSDPFSPEAETPAVHKNMGHSSMSMLTALNLSFHNLWTKKVRTLLIAFAGSIGIIGIAMILSMSNGVNRYIQTVEEDTLKSYPLQITNSSFNLANFIPNAPGETQVEDAEVHERHTVTSLLSTVSVNDLASLRAHLESGETDVYDHVQAIEYGYGITPQIFTLTEDSVRQVNPDRSFAAMGFSMADGMSSLFSAMTSTDSFHPMPGNTDLYVGQYDVKAGRWPERWNECVLVLSASGMVSDLALYTMGVKDPAELEAMVRAFVEGGQIPDPGREQTYRYTDFTGIRFRVVPAASFYVYDETYKVWTNRSDDEKYLRSILADAETLEIVGVVQPREEESNPTLRIGICYPAELTMHLMQAAAESDIVRAQQTDPHTDVFTGRGFGEAPNEGDVDMSSLFTVNEDALKEAFQMDGDLPLFDPEKIDFSKFDLSQIDLSKTVDPSAFASAMPGLTQEQLASLFSGIKLNLSSDQLQALFSELAQGYAAYLRSDPSTDYTKLPEAMIGYLRSGAAAERIRTGIQSALADNNAAMITQDELIALLQDVVAEYPTYLAEQGLDTDGVPLAYLGQYLSSEQGQTALNKAAADLNARAERFLLSPAQLAVIAGDLISDYSAYAAENNLPSPETLQTSLAGYLSGKEAGEMIRSTLLSALDTSDLERQAKNLFAGFSYQLADAMNAAAGQMAETVGAAIRDTLQSQMETLAEDLGEQLESALKIDPETLADAFSMNMDPAELRDLMTALISRQSNTYDGNLHTLGFAEEERPDSITIYPRDFEGKRRVKQILEDYNTRMTETGQEEKVITYTDVVDTLMSSVTDIVDAISTVLIAFVAISLVVSSVMIGVITYISVLERRKEIGILRAIGASKHNISTVFNAETFIIGGLAGLLGVGITYLLLIPANRIIASLTGQVDIRAYLPLTAAGILVALSIVLTLLGGLIPAKKAARSDPVSALRSE